MAQNDVEGACGTYVMPPDGWVCFHCGESIYNLGHG